MERARGDYQMGVISKLVVKKYFGFIQTADNTEEYYFHGSRMAPGTDFFKLREGAPVRFRIVKDRRSDRDKAVDVEVGEQLSPALTGTILKLIPDGAYGFITPDDGGASLYFHKAGVIDAGDYEDLQEGERVGYIVATDRQDRPRAIGVTRIN